MATASLSTVDAILKDDYKDYIDQLNNALFLISQVETRKDTVVGRIARHAIHLGRSSGVGARAGGVHADARLPRGVRRVLEQARAEVPGEVTCPRPS